MKVIKHGKFFEMGPATCNHCGCVFTFNKSEIITSFNKDEGYDENYVTCPECKSSVIFSENQLCAMLG